MAVITQLPKAIRPVRDDAASFRAAFRHLAGGVSVITTGRGEDRTGLTATSISSLSAEPPTIFFGLNLSSSSYPVLQRHRSFGVNFLSATQKQVADRFAGRGGFKGDARFGEGDWTRLVTGAPVLEGALAILDCETEEAIERHSHTILIGRVKAIREAETEGALLYWRGIYGKLDETLQYGAGI
ncbi:MAG TPA: flavin reductase family protein [Xanthobacteraceae bacterium]|nr:flavin reductase family protein [Xanthobacteraceae bacterium]